MLAGMEQKTAISIRDVPVSLWTRVWTRTLADSQAEGKRVTIRETVLRALEQYVASEQPQEQS
jgi:hypothetical protein